MSSCDQDSLSRLLDRPAIQDLGCSLGSNQVRLVGGCVRDACQGVIAQDLDACTPLPPYEIMAKLTASEMFRAYPTGVDHGTVTAFHPASNQRIEVTTLRQDIKTDGRRAKVEFGTTWAKDASRRDFTFNALMLDLRGNLYDDFNGRADLAAGRVRFIGDPAARLAEDWLRALRYVRFWAHYGSSQPDESTRQALRGAAPQLTRLSVERIWQELKRLAMAPRFWPALALFENLGFAKALGLSLDWPASYPDLSTMSSAHIWGALLGPTATTTLQRLRASSAERNNAVAVAKSLASQESWFARQVRYGHGAAVAAHRWTGQDGNLEEVKNFPIRGQDLCDQGFPPGPNLGLALQILREEWIRTGGRISRVDLLAYLNRSRHDLISTARINDSFDRLV